MTFNTVNQYSGNHKTWDHVGNIFPGVTVSAGERPHFEFRAAAWLPVQVFEKFFENWIVIMPGKLLALDPDGRVMPAQYGLTDTSSNVVYTASDVTAGTIDVSTGAAVTTAKTVVMANLTGVKDVTWTVANAGTGAVTSGFMGRFSVDVAMGTGGTARYPIGVSPQVVLQDAALSGDLENPAEFNQHNYKMDLGPTVLCDYVLRLPLIPGQVTSETVDGTVTGSALVVGTQATFSRSNVQANDRYDASTGNVPIASTYPLIGLALDNFPIAKNTARTQLVLSSTSAADDLSSVLANEKSSPSGIRVAGDYYVDLDAGVIMLYSADGATVPAVISGAAGTVSIEYYHYGTAGGTIAGTSISRFGCVVSTTTELTPGDFLGCGSDSNWVRVSTGTAAEATMVGQVLGFEKYPRGGLERVRTAYVPALQTNASGGMSGGTAATSSVGLGQLDQMPGSATGGVDASLHYAGGANVLVIVNLIKR